MIAINWETAYKYYKRQYPVYKLNFPNKFTKVDNIPESQAENYFVWERWGKRFYVKYHPPKLWNVFF